MIVLVVAVALVVWLVLLVRPTEFPPTKVPDQWAAEAASLVAALSSLVATVIATVAFVNSSERPALRLEAYYLGRDEPLAMSWSNGQPDDSGQITSTDEYSDWWLALILSNRGPVAARFIAIDVYFGGGAKLETKGQTLLKHWQTRIERWTSSSDFRWEGGADAVVHPSWPYQVPLLGPTYLIFEGPQSQTSFQFRVDVVADDVPTFNKRFTIHVALGK